MLGSLGWEFISSILKKNHICFQNKSIDAVYLTYGTWLQDETLRNAVNAFKGRHWKKIGCILLYALRSLLCILLRKQ
jgi:hypothetical protein